MEDMIRMLADVPEEQRKAMIKSRLEMVAAMPEEQRSNAMSEMISAIARLPDDKRTKMISTRNRVVAEFPNATRDSIMRTRIKVGTKLPKGVNESDMTTMMQTLGELPDNLKTGFVNSMKAQFEEAGMAMPQMPGMAMPALQPDKQSASAPASSGPVDMVKAQEDMMRQLASAPEAMRRTALRGRWDEILKGSDQGVGESIKVMMLALARLPDEQRRSLIRTRTEVIGSLDEDQIKRILRGRTMAMKGTEDIDREDQMIAMEEMPWVPEAPRMRFATTMSSYMKSMGMAAPSMPSTPVHHGKPMEKKGFISKNWRCATCGRGFPAT